MSALEFDVLWGLLGRDRLPYPLQCRGAADTADDHHSARRDAARRIRPMLDEGLYGAFTILLAPTVRVEICGFHGHGHGHGLATVVRAHAGVRGERATLVRQEPGVDLESGADVVLSSLPSGQLPERIVESLPAARRGARRGAASAGPSRRVGTDGPLMVSATRRGPEEERDEFFDRPRTGLGEIGVFAGPAVDWRPTADGHVVHWMDFEGDGRYLVRGTDIVSALPVGGDDIASELHRLIGLARDER
ncbi:ESX secretion-associated protein EspG [Rhodococcus spelaei]|uniref:ESX secretion-associated protein EspG n=1 Tax=Rhodococcus spelaei TaxID=2546320 RepID=UPI0015EE40D7|nr:ESX secretion-associated protein EspG [Rhodococcus spelaei]